MARKAREALKKSGRGRGRPRKDPSEKKKRVYKKKPVGDKKCSNCRRRYFSNSKYCVGSCCTMRCYEVWLDTTLRIVGDPDDYLSVFQILPGDKRNR